MKKISNIAASQKKGERVRAKRRCCREGLFAVLLVLGILFAGCQAKGTDGVVVAMNSAPNSLDPRLATSDASAKLIGLVYAGLTTVDTKDGDLALELAKSIKNPSPTTYEVQLKEDIYFHDGTAVESKDVKYTLTQLDSENLQSIRAGIARRIESFKIESPKSFRIELKEPHAPFLINLSLGIVPKHRCEGRETCKGKPVGAGPYRFVSRRGDSQFVLERFDQFWGESPKPERLVFRVITDSNTLLLSSLGGSTDITQNTISPVMLPVVEDSPRLKIETSPSFKYTYLAFNLRDSVLSDLAVRRAIAYGIDREAIIAHKFRGHARKSSGLLAPKHWAYNGDVKTYDYDPKKAATILEEAGYEKKEDGSRLEINFKVSTNQFRRTIAKLIARQLARIDIKVNVRAYEWGTLYADIKNGNFEMTSMQWPTIPGPDIYRYIFHSENIPNPDEGTGGANRGAYANKRVDKLLEKGRRVTDRAKRKKIYGEIQQILAKELPYVSLWHEDNIAVLQKQIEGYYMTPNARYEGLLDVTRNQE